MFFSAAFQTDNANECRRECLPPPPKMLPRNNCRTALEWHQHCQAVQGQVQLHG